MISLRSIIIFCASITYISTKKYHLIEDIFTLDKIPGGVVAEILTLATTGVLQEFFGCMENPYYKEDDVKLWLFTKKRPNKPLRLNTNRPNQLNLKKPLKILIHGWLGNSSDGRIIDLKNAYLKNYDCNVIGVEWTTYAIDLYAESFCYVPKIAETIGDYLCFITNHSNETLESIHIVGHSLGGQMAGLIGQMVKTMCQKTLGRITALDPAGPLFRLLPEDRRLDPSDALFVDVIHTNQHFLGYSGGCGTADFYPNCGSFQPGCLFKKIISLKDVIHIPVRHVLCNHFRSIDYMVESIYSKRFVATSCSNCPSLCIADIESPSRAIMGEHTHLHRHEINSYYIATNDKSPFAQG